MLEDAGEAALCRQVGRPRASHLDGEAVLRPVTQLAGHLEGVGEEVALGVAQVGAVEPGVAQIEDPVEDQPAAPSG